MKQIIIVLGLILTIYSCKNSIKKEKDFALYPANKYTQKPTIGDTIIYRYMLQVNDSTIYNSFITERPSIQGINKQSHGGLDIYSALTKMSKGDSAVFYINADSFFNKTNFAPKPSFIPTGIRLRFSVKIEDIKNKQQMQEYRALILQNEIEKETIRIKNYIGNDSANYKLYDGAFIKTHKKGKGLLPATGTTIELNIKGETHRGVLLVDTRYTGNSMKYKLGSGTIIPIILEKIFATLKQGQIIKIIIPYKYAYGIKGYANVAPFSTLYYEVERL